MIAKGYDYFHFAGSIFNVPKIHAINVCKEIIRRKLPLQWHAHTSLYRFDDELAELMLGAGCDGVIFRCRFLLGKMLAEIGKNFKKKEIFQGADACRKLDLEFSLNILFGSPGENMETVNETLEALDEIRPTAAFLTQGIRVYTGTPIHKKLIDLGKISPTQPLPKPFFYFSEELPPDFNDFIFQWASAREDYVFSDTKDKPSSTSPEAIAIFKESYRGPHWRVLKKLQELRKREQQASSGR